MIKLKNHLEYEFLNMEYWRSREVLNIVSPDFLQNQCEINGKMRQVLVDWLVEVSSIQINNAK